MIRKRWRWIVAGAVVVVLAVGGAGLGYYLYIRGASADIRGSSTQEFTPSTQATTAPKPPPKKPPKNAALTRIDWPTYGHDAQRLRFLASPFAPPFRVQWTFRAKHLLEFPPAIAYGRAFIANNPGVLYAVEAASGRVAWSADFERCTAASPAVADRVVYMAFLNLRAQGCNAQPGTAGLDGLVVALDERSGKLIWKHTIGPSETSPLVADGKVFVGDWTGKVYALSAKTGKEVWDYQTGGQVKGAVALTGHRLFAGSYDHHLYAIDSRNGHLIWSSSSQDRLGGRGTFYSTPATAYGRVYIGSTDGKVYSFGASTGDIRWSQSTGGYVYASPAVWNEAILIGSYSGRFFSLDAATGDEHWHFDAGGPISGSATVLGGVVYFSTLKGMTFALDASTGKRLWSFPDGKYSPIVAGPDRVYLTGYTRLYGMQPLR